jgi:cell division protease FtsH
MAQNDPRKQDKNSRNLGNDNNFNWRGILLFACAIALLGGFFFSRSGGYGNVEEIPYTEFQQYLNEGRISKDEPLQLIVTEGKSTQVLRGAFDRERKPNVGGNAPDHFKTTVFLEFDKNLKQDLESKGYKVDIRADSDVMIQALLNFAPVLLIFVAIYFFFRQQIRNAGKGALSFGKSKARMLSRDRNRVTFKDVAGVEEAKEEVQEIVDFLKDPKKFQKLGGRIPKGVLMVGPPGTGKTLLARAIAGEADVPFYSISGSDFVEMFVGVGASRVRDMFEQGKKSAPCIIFIDEIDAVGRHRGHGLGGGHDEREQTLNALLVEMDGFDTQEGVIIIAATNRPDVLDPALLRPGRFDRQITVNLPDVKGREEILRVHAKRVKLAEGVDLAVVARGTPGYSGAELANVINEAALLAARRGLKAITMPELEEARDKVRWGKERRSLAIGEKEKENTAYHEAGHALLCEVLEYTDPVHKVTIIPRGPSLGSTMYLPVEDRYNNRKNELLDRLVVIMGGRVAEEMVFGDVTSGASGDIRMGTGIARKMVCEWGMSERLGMVEYGEHEDYVFLGRDISRSRAYSEATAQEIDREVKRLCDDAYQQAMKILTQRKETLIAIAKALLEYETLDGSQVREIINHGRLLNPPPPIPPVKPSEPRAEGETIRPAPEELGGLTEAPA